MQMVGGFRDYLIPDRSTCFNFLHQQATVGFGNVGLLDVSLDGNGEACMVFGCPHGPARMKLPTKEIGINRLKPA